MPICCPVATFHRAVPSSSPVARVLPSGLNATEIDSSGPVQAADLLPGGHVPQLRRAVVVAGGQGLAVRAERHGNTGPWRR